MHKSLPLVDCYHRKESNCIKNNNPVVPNDNPNLMHHEKTENQKNDFQI